MRNFDTKKICCVGMTLSVLTHLPVAFWAMVAECDNSPIKFDVKFAAVKLAVLMMVFFVGIIATSGNQ